MCFVGGPLLWRGAIPRGVSDALLGLAAGLAAGAVMTRGGLCFNRALRRATFERKPALLRAFAIAVAAQLLLLPLLIALGVGTLERSADAGGPALLPAAQLLGENVITGLTGAGYQPLALVLGVVALAALITCRRGGLIAGLALGAVAAATWAAADAATASMAAGALLTWRLLLSSRPGLRGHERVLST